ncbi:MAG: hypothetical protein QOE71_878, partial [Pseudonocardiales bacterium]|nr:hypothetical protein [Pseudonocardiales bacterium]
SISVALPRTAKTTTTGNATAPVAMPSSRRTRGRPNLLEPVEASVITLAILISPS